MQVPPSKEDDLFRVCFTNNETDDTPKNFTRYANQACFFLLFFALTIPTCTKMVASEKHKYSWCTALEAEHEECPTFSS